jgi:hypothetical protein
MGWLRYPLLRFLDACREGWFWRRGRKCIKLHDIHKQLVFIWHTTLPGGYC